jgi:hypothetical protein
MGAPANGVRRPVVAWIFALLLLTDGSRAEEVAPYKLTGVDGYVTLQYLQDQQTTDQPGAPRSRQAQSGFRNEIFAMTHSYVYHPNLLTLDIGGGPVLHSESYIGDTGETRARGALYNFTARAMLLRDKPYTGDLFFSHLNPTVSVGPGQVLTQENTRYGFDFSLLAAASPVPLQMGFTRSHSLGRGVDRMVDDSLDQFNLSATRSFGALGSTQVQYQTSRQASLSGSQDLPIQESKANSQSVNVDTRLSFGDRRQYDLTNVISVNSQDYSLQSGAYPQLKDARVMLDLRARHSDQLNSYGFYNYGHSSQGELDSVTQAASVGLSYWPTTGLETSLGVRGDNNQTRQFTAQSHGLDGSIRYEQPLPIGVAQASYGIRYDSRAQQALTPQTGVLGERVTLSGVTYVALARPYVVADSPTVTNAGRTQTFVANVDYELTVVGTETRLQRLIGGRILDGEQVLVDYSYDIGGTYAYNQVDQTLNLNWNLSRYTSAYFRHFTSSPRLASGSPTFPLNEVRSSTCGLRADLPFNVGLPITVGGGIEYEDRQETVAPYRRTAEDLYLQTDEPLFGLGNVRASLRRSRIDYAVAAQNSDLRGYELRFWARQWFGSNMTAALSGERDDGGLIPRHRVDGSIGLQWQERKFTLTSSLVRTREFQAAVERERTTFQFLAKRDF